MEHSSNLDFQRKPKIYTRNYTIRPTINSSYSQSRTNVETQLTHRNQKKNGDSSKFNKSITNLDIISYDVLISKIYTTVQI